MSRTLATDIPLFAYAHALVARARGESVQPHLQPIIERRHPLNSEEPVLKARLLAAAESASAETLREVHEILERSEALQFFPVLRAAAIVASRIELAAGNVQAAAESMQRALLNAQFCAADIDYMPDVWLAGFEVFTATGDGEAAQDCLRKGVAWVQAVEREHMPDEFREEFPNTQSN